MARNQASRPITSLYAEVTDRIILELEAGCLPWVQPWEGWAPVGMPRNAITGRRYSGINVLILWDRMAREGYTSQRWMTYRQAQAIGANVRRGEIGTTVCYADRFTPQESAVSELPLGDDAQRRQVAFLKRFTLFNVEQCEALPVGFRDEELQLDFREPFPEADALIAATGADFRVGGAHAFYVPDDDYVRVPPQSAFADPVHWYRTALHELAHWTGHPGRLDRFERGMNREAFGREELVAEMGAAFVCAELGMLPSARHPEYASAWLDILRADAKAIFRAASRASKAANYLLACRAAGVAAGAEDQREAA